MLTLIGHVVFTSLVLDFFIHKTHARQNSHVTPSSAVATCSMSSLLCDLEHLAPLCSSFLLCKWWDFVRIQ